MRTSIESVSVSEVPELVQRLRPLYLDAYSDPPYGYTQADADEFVARMSDQSSRPNFALYLAVDRECVAGFTYGFTFPQNQWWRGSEGSPDPSLVSAEKFAVIELVVDRAYRGRGLSKELLRTLVQGRTEQLATLLAKPGSQARDMYERWGWKQVGTVRSYPHWPVDDAMILDLDSRLSHLSNYIEEGL